MYWDGEGWYSLLEQVSKRSLPNHEALARAESARVSQGDARWSIPMAMALWLRGITRMP